MYIYLLGRGYIHGCRPGVPMSKWLFTRLPGISRNVIYTAAVCPHKIFIYTAAVKVPNRLYTRLPYMFSKKGYLHGSHSRAISAIYK